MKKQNIIILGLLSVLLIAAVPISQLKLTSNADGNGYAITNLGSVSSTNFIDAATGLPISGGGPTNGITAATATNISNGQIATLADTNGAAQARMTNSSFYMSGGGKWQVNSSTLNLGTGSNYYWQVAANGTLVSDAGLAMIGNYTATYLDINVLNHDMATIGMDVPYGFVFYGRNNFIWCYEQLNDGNPTNAVYVTGAPVFKIMREGAIQQTSPYSFAAGYPASRVSRTRNDSGVLTTAFGSGIVVHDQWNWGWMDFSTNSDGLSTNWTENTVVFHTNGDLAVPKVFASELGAMPLNAGLVLDLEFSGTNTTHRSRAPGDFTAIQSGTAWRTNGPLGYALHCPGTNYTYTFGNWTNNAGTVANRAFSGLSNLTVSAVFRTTTTPAFFVNKAGEYQLCAINGGIFLRLTTTTSNYWQIAAGNTTWSNGGWHQLTGTFDGTNAALYFDGTFATNVALANPGILLTNAGSVKIPDNSLLTGDITQAKIWNRCLGSNEVALLYSQSGIPNQAGTNAALQTQISTNVVNLTTVSNQVVNLTTSTANNSNSIAALNLVTNLIPIWSTPASTFTNITCVRIPVYTNGGVTYYLTLSTNKP